MVSRYATLGKEFASERRWCRPPDPVTEAARRRPYRTSYGSACFHFWNGYPIVPDVSAPAVHPCGQEGESGVRAAHRLSPRLLTQGGSIRATSVAFGFAWTGTGVSEVAGCRTGEF
jgi:hypothetical protein